MVPCVAMFANIAMKRSNWAALFVVGLISFVHVSHAAPVEAAVKNGWLSWRGPEQNGTSREKGLPSKLALKGENLLWTIDFPGASTPVIADGKLYICGFVGEGAELQEGIACFEAETGKKLWQRLYRDYLSDIIYSRYATSSPAIDAETGNVYMQGTQGILAAFTADGKPLWEHSMMEKFGRLTFPNGRTATPTIDDDLVITRGITANWGAHGPGGDRFYAFDKRTGELVWASSPADRPKDSSFSYPYLGWLDGMRVLYSTAADGSVVCINARTGDPLWRVPLGKAGINATVLVHNQETVIAIYGTPYEPGQMVAFKVPKVTLPPGEAGPAVVERSQVELWSNDISTSTSSPILVGDRIYVIAEKGDLYSVDVKSGKVLWSLKIGIEQRNSCPLYADGKLYVPMLDVYAPMLQDTGGKSEGGVRAGSSGGFYVIEPGDSEGKILSHVVLDGKCFGSPTAYNGKVYVQTTKHLYCFVKPGNNAGLPALIVAEKRPQPGPAKQLQIIPSEVLLRPGQAVAFRARTLDSKGFVVEQISDMTKLKWASYIPPTARVRAALKGSFDGQGRLVAAQDSVPSAGAFEASLGDVKGYIRGRVLPYLPITQNFESMTLSDTNATDNAMFAYPPLPWIGARFKFEVRQVGDTKALVKTIDNKFFQRATVFLGDPSARNYTIEADVMSEGKPRRMSEVGLINQRYLIVLKGNEQKLEINSNLERLRVAANFKWVPDVWYHLKSRVDLAADGSGVIRAKAWKRGEPEPEQWTIEVPHQNAHQLGAPGLFGFSPQDMRVSIDNISVTSNEVSAKR
jgi:outer membrane protein assembly factor BamB